MTTFYLDYVNGNDAADGSTFALGGLPTVGPWKTLTLGATLLRIGPADIIKIAKSPAPYSIGNTTWTNLSKTVTLDTAATLNVENCEQDWHTDNATSSAKIGTDWKQGTYAVKIVEAASPSADQVQAHYPVAIVKATIDDYQAISFWIKNEVAILANQLELNLCSVNDGTGDLDVFPIPAIPSTGRWVCLTITRDGGTNLGNNGATDIASINISNGSNATTYTAGKYIYLDNIIAVTVPGLNLQSLISKNTAEKDGTEGWYGIQSINGVTVLLDNDTNALANAGRGYSGATGNAATYARETIKTAMAATSGVVVQEIMDSGTSGNNIQFQGGYDTSTGDQTGETFFDGLNGYGSGIYVPTKNFITFNYLNAYRYNYGIHFATSNNNTITTITNGNNNANHGIYFNTSNNNTITTITNANNNFSYGVYFTTSNNNTITTITNVNNNNSSGVGINNSNNNTITTITNGNNNANYGVIFNNSSNNTINSLYIKNNTISSIYNDSGYNYINTAVLDESIKVSTLNYSDGKVFIQSIGGFANIWCNAGNIISQNATAGGTGIEWKVNITNVIRNITFPLKFKLAEFAVSSGNEVTITCFFKKSQNADMYAALVIPGLQPGGDVADVVAPCSNNTARNQLQVQFTPSAAGVFVVEAWAYWLLNVADENVLIDDIAISQV